MGTVIDLYERQVMRIALHQCRCETGADLQTERPKTEPEDPDTPDAA